MGMPSMPELLVILAIVVLLFGAKKIPELAKGLGSGIKNFKKALQGGRRRGGPDHPQRGGEQGPAAAERSGAQRAAKSVREPIETESRAGAAKAS